MLLAWFLLACEPPVPYDDIFVEWTTTDTGDAPVQNTWAEVPLLSDLVWISSETALAIEIERRAIVTVDLPSGLIKSTVELSGTPERLAWSAEQQRALVTQGEEGAARLLMVDPTTRHTEVIPLTFEGANYPAYDVAWSQDESFAWVLTADPDNFLLNWVLKVNTTARAVESVHRLESSYAGTRIHAADDDLYIGHERFELDDPLPAELAVVTTYPKNVLDPHRLQLSSDGSGTLWPDAEVLYERDRTTADILTTYAHHDTWGVHGPEQWIYSADNTRVFTLGVDFTTHQVQAFHRASGALEETWNLTGPERSQATFYDVQVMLTEPDDSRIYVYAHQDFVEATGFIKWVDIDEL